MKKTSILGALVLCLAFGLPPAAHAKLPPLSPEAKLKADEAKLKTAWSDKVGAYQLCQAQDRAAANYLKTAKAAGKDLKVPASAAPCADPGPYVPPPPIEAAGAHSPSTTAVAPPNTTQPAAAQQAAGAAPVKK